MRAVTAICVTALGISASGCRVDRAEEKPKTWRNDFQLFLGRLQRAADDSRQADDGRIRLERLDREFLHAKVRWTGTLKYFRKGRPYFVESFVRVSDDTKLSAVMYYADPERASEWEGLPGGTRVEYEGTVSAVQVEAVIVKDGFAFIDLRDVRLLGTGK